MPRISAGCDAAMDELFLGIDAGQTVTKAVLFDLDGRQRAVGSAKVALDRPSPRWVERDMTAVWHATVRAIRRCLVEAGIRGGDVVAVGLAGHADGVYAVDDELRPVRPAITAMDTRAHETVAGWQAGEVAAQALELTGQVPFAGSPAALLAWLRQHEPETLTRARWLLFCKDWLKVQLTGEVSTDPTEASASFTDVRTQDYSVAALDLFGLADLRVKLPPILPSERIAGRVTEEAGATTGLAPGTPVVAGAHDVDATAIGMGATEPGTLSLVAGTFSINQIVSDHVCVDPRWQARNFVHPGRWMNMATSPASATNLEWFLDSLGVPGTPGEDPYVAATREVSERLSGRSEILYHPFLYGSPHGGHASAAFIGVRGWHDRGDLLRAMFEGVVLNHRVHIDALRDRFDLAPAVRLGGGAARSDVWAQMFADALHTTVEITDADEAGARGAALLAALGIGALDTLKHAASLAHVDREHIPDPDRGAVLDEAYAAYLAAIDALEPVWRRLA